MDISIHAPLTGSDPPIEILGSFRGNFNPRSPYGERPPKFWSPLNSCGFQSTLPLRGATCPVFLVPFPDWISIHAPLTGSDGVVNFAPANGAISIHAPLTGSDPRYNIHQKRPQQFQSTLPLRGATIAMARFTPGPNDFNPRSPYGERLSKPRLKPRLYYFNPRSPYGERLG